ncbi:MAG: hypothetical protein DI624_04575 [Brevundimonas sp.]|uniref:YfbU family protein n=1 Tax=Brevundimonas sp. TaxID=1871086 RepID=UPI000DB27F9B|nr:YfbU family protein [Brevundimonas sp.]PZT99709.1 MAG: hypothetical protein DI624_04575 [Brevundimonas sp.]
MKLTLAERLALRNQLQIMKELEVGDLTAEQYDEKIQIVEGGYEVYYPDLINGINEEGIDPEVTAEVLDVLSLYRALHHAEQSGITLPSKGYAKFAGFDGNHEPHYGFSVFVLDVQGNFSESAPSKNSHGSGALSRYRRMLEAWDQMGRPFDLDQAAVDAIFA